MSLDRIWAGWRAEYLTEAVTGSTDDCVLCRLAAADDAEALVVARTERAFVVMNAYPYVSGHVMVAPLRHEATLAGLDAGEAREVMALVQQAEAAITAAYTPDGLNVGANLGRAAGAGVPGHAHLHVLPRWAGDTNFMTAVAEARVLPEPLRSSYDRLRSAWPNDA